LASSSISSRFDWFRKDVLCLNLCIERYVERLKEN
jgi:hypothetical protein